MKRLIAVLVLAALASGCASVMANRGLQSAASVRADNGQVQAGVNLFDLQTAMDHPWVTLGSVVVDGVLAYYLVDTAEHYMSKGDDPEPEPPTYYINGDYSIYNVSYGDNSGNYSPQVWGTQGVQE